MMRLDDFKAARNVLKGILNDTGLIYSQFFSKATGNYVYLKPENMQVTGAYKIRGAYYKISTLTQEQRERGLVTASAGNHAQGVAYAAQAAGVPECYYCPTKAEARPVLDGVVRPHATILVKASRGMALEELVDYLLTITGEA